MCGPYVGTVLSTVGDRKRPLVEALADALRVAAGEIAAGNFDHVTVEGAATALRLPDDLAASCRLRVRQLCRAFAGALFLGSAVAAVLIGGVAETHRSAEIFGLATALAIPLGLFATVGRTRWIRPEGEPGR